MPKAKPSSPPDPIEDYLSRLSSPARETLQHLRQTIRSLLPTAAESIKYGMPAFTLDGKGICSYAGFKNHCSYFPMSSGVLERAASSLSGFEVSKGGLRFENTKPLQKSLLARLIKLRLEELGAVTDGVRLEYSPKGQLKATGKMKDGELHGHWKWFRLDGSLLRSGQFKSGQQVGTWVTYDRSGQPLKSTKF